DLLNEIILVESVGAGLGVDLCVGLRPRTRPVARQAHAGNLVATSFVHRALHRALEAAVHTRTDVAGFDIDARPLVVGRGSGDRLDQPEIVVVDVDQTGDHATVFGKLL